MEITTCFDGDDFVKNRYTIRIRNERNTFMFRCKNEPGIINSDLYFRLQLYKAIKIFKSDSPILKPEYWYERRLY